MTSRLAAAGILAACASVSLAQVPLIPGLPPMPRVRVVQQQAQQNADDAVDTQAVYVRDSGVASERLQLAERLEKQKEWTKAADVLQDAAQKYADRVVPVRYDKAGRPVQYVSATQTVQDRLAKWPAEGIAAYRKRFEDTARDALTADTTERTAVRVMTLYFLTDAGRDAAMTVMATAFERGDFVTAAGVGRRLLESHPSLDTVRPKVLVSTGLAEHLAGRDTDAKARLSEITAHFADAIVSIGGTDAKAGETLAAALAVPAAPPGRYRSDDWPTPYGTPDAAAVPEQVCVGGARLFSVALPGPTRRTGNPQGVPQYRNAQTADRKSGASFGILPAVDGGALYFQDNARVWAVGLSTGLPLPGWAATYAGSKAGCYAIDADPTPRNRQTGVTVTGDSVVALLSQFDGAASPVGQSPQPPQLACLDKLTGRRNWAVTANALKLPETLANLREGVFYGTPVADDTAVYVPLYANRGGQFEECYLVALNLSDGAFRWASYVASTSLGNRQLDFNGVTDSNTLTIATLSLAGGRLYVASNLGAVGCLDTADGRTLWLNVYEKTKQQLSGFVAPAKQSSKPYAFGPPIIADGRVFALPTDSPSILIYDADDGTPVKTIPRAGPKPPPISAIVGVVDQFLIVASPSTVLRLPWRSYDPTKSILENGGAIKAIPPAEDDKSMPPDSIRGRIFLSGKSILVPSAERLYRLSSSTLQIESTYPAQGKWDEEESAGNIVATPENLIVAGPTRVTAYTDLAVATAKLDSRIAATPTDVDAYLRYAELLLAAGQSKPALDKLDLAVTRLGGRGSLTAGPLRDRLFDIATSFAGKLQRTDPTSAAIVALYDRAAAAASTPDQQARYRLGRAALLRSLGKAEDELAVHQQILVDPAWRATPVAGRVGPSTAGVEAETGVNELLRLRGVALYKDYDRTAFEKLQAIKSSPAPEADALSEIADAFPAATCAADALALAADRMESTGDAGRASKTLRRLLTRDLSNDRRQSVLQALARNALRLPNQAAIAQMRLRQATAIAPEAKPERPLLLPDGSPLKADSLSAAVGAIDAYRAKAAEDALPTLGAPLTTPEGSDFTKPAFMPAEVVAPAVAIIAQQADLARPNRIVIVNAAGKVGIVNSGTAAVKWTDAAPPRTPIGCGYVGDLLVVVGADEVSGVDAAGHVRWTLRAAGLTPIEATPMPGAIDDRATDSDVEMPVRPMNPRRVVIRRGGRFGRWPALPPRPIVDDAPPPLTEEFARFRLLSDRAVLTTSTGRTIAIDATGKALWQARPSETAAGRLVSNDDFVAVSHTDPAGSAAQVCVFDAQTGQIVQRKSYESSQPAGTLMNLALSPDGVLVTMLAGRLVAQDLYDPGSGERRYDRPNNGFGDPLFAQSNVDGQLVVAGDRVLAVVRGNDGRQAVRAFDLRTMRPLTTKEPNGRESEISFTPGGTESDLSLPVTLRTGGRALYVVGQRSFASYGLAKSEQAWTASNGAGDLGPIRDVIVAKDFVVLVRQVALSTTSSLKLPAINISMFNRTWLADLDRENGSLEQRPTVEDPAAIEAGEWQVTDGAFYYVAGDGQLKVLRTNR